MSYIPRYTNLLRLFDECVDKYGDQPLFGTRKPAGWEWMSYRAFADLVADARGGLAALGVEAGDRVAVISNNRVEWAACAYATYSRAATWVPMYESQLDAEWQYILQDAGAKVCFVANGRIRERVRTLQGDLPALQHVVDFEGPTYAKMLARGKEHPVDAVMPGDRDVATFIYTSGTTGNPKGVRLTHYNLAANVSGLLETDTVAEGDRSLGFLPWAHVFGGSVELNCVIAVGGSMAICDNTDNLVSYLPEVQPTMLFAVPRIWNRIYDGVQKQIASKPGIIQTIFHTGLRARTKRKRNEPLTFGESIALPLAEKLVFSKVVARFGGKLRFAFSGAAALSPEVAQFIDNLGIEVYEGYGLTESSGCTTANVPAATRLGSVGKPIAGVEIRIDKRVTGTEAAAGEGEVVIYGTGVMAGYHNLETETRESLTPDGGLRTGDLGRLDEDGFLYITGRVKELFKLENGKYVAPAPIEERLQLSPYIAQCVVYGANKPHIVALIVPDMVSLRGWAEANDVSTETLLTDPRTRELIRNELDGFSRGGKGFEAVHDFLLSAEELTTQNDMLTPTMKLKRRNVNARYGARLDALYDVSVG
jgi:long-chain acyl-CoA synthetase